MIGYNRNMALIYCNILVVIEASVIFMIFTKIDMGNVKWINQYSAACFTVFLIHGHFLSHIKIDWAVHQNLMIMIGHIILCSVLIHLICFIAYKVYDFIWKKVSGLIDRKDVVITQLKIGG